MQRWWLRLADLGDIHRLTYPYMARGRRIPDAMEELEAAHIQEATALAERHPSQPLILVGKSMGGRVSVRIADRIGPAAVVVFGYPLISSGKKKTRRDAPLRAVRTPTLLIQGTRDPMAPVPEVMDLVADHPTGSLQVRVVEHGDHSLESLKRPLRARGLNQGDIDEEICFDIGRFIAAVQRAVV